MAITHAFSNTIADATGTVTVWNGATTSTVPASVLVKPSDWNSAHAMAFTLTGNTTQNSTVSGTDILFAGSGNVSVGGSNGSIVISGPATGSTFTLTGNTTLNSTVSGANIVFAASGGVKIGGSNGSIVVSVGAMNTLVPWYPGSTSSQTAGAIGVTTASAMFFPIVVPGQFEGNVLKQAFSVSLATTTVAASQTITSQFGIYTNNAGTLSQLSSGSFSIALSQSSISGTLSFPTSTGTGGYGYGTVAWSSTATAQSLVGTAGNRLLDLQFGGNLTIPRDEYYIGYFQRQNTAGAAAGLSTAYVGNVMAPVTNMGPIGQSTAAFSSRSDYHMNVGFYTSTGSAGYGGTALPVSVHFSGLNYSGNVLPLLTFAST